MHSLRVLVRRPVFFLLLLHARPAANALRIPRCPRRLSAGSLDRRTHPGLRLSPATSVAVVIRVLQIVLKSLSSKLKKHFFFSYVGECILNNNNPKTRNPDIVCNAFEGACNAYLLWRSNFLYFPIGLDEHWFSFVVCMKDRAFVFLDSAFGDNSTYHRDIRDELIHNFIGLWDAYATPMMHKRINFEEFDVLYPVVPKQDNRHDYGVFTFKYMEIFTPITQRANLFSSADIANLRIKYANGVFFGPLNSCDKSLVTDFFLYVCSYFPCRLLHFRLLLFSFSSSTTNPGLTLYIVHILHCPF